MAPTERSKPKDTSSQASKKAKKAAARAQQGGQLPEHIGRWVDLGGSGVLLVLVLLAGYGIGYSSTCHSSVENRVHILVRIAYFIIIEVVAYTFFASAMQELHRQILGPLNPGGAEPRESGHDPSIAWPVADLLSEELKPFTKKTEQPFFLNHVPGRWRRRDAMMRFGMTIGALVAVAGTSALLDNRSVSELGLRLDKGFFIDMQLGFAVGVSIIAFTWFVELKAGWLHFLQTFEVFDRTERFSECFFWDVVFHMNVAFNEELPVRGWMLFNLADALKAHFSMEAIQCFVLAMVIESILFVVMHLNSPGGARLQSMVNIFVGGMAGGLNVLLASGQLGFALGWHFGWNISMGNIFGLSTSGIPISATVLAVAPHPEKEALHGGVFGPEGGVVAPAAYSLGIVLALLIYGWPQLP